MKIQEKGADYLVRSQAAEWQRGTLGELLPIKYGKSLPEKLRDTTGSHPVFGSSGRVGIHSAALTVGPTLIIGRKGNVGAIHYSSEACWPIDTVYYVEPPEGQKLRYYKYLLESLNLVKLDKSTAVPGLSRDDYNAVEVVVAPPDQQDGIVAEIEKQFSRLDEAVSNLKSVKANLKRYKAAVLKAAVEGRLVETEAELARREGRSYETGAQLLQRILETRRSQWQGKGRYKEPAAPDTTDLPELPEGWVWATLDQIGQEGRPIIYGIIKPGPHDPNGVPYVRVTEMKDGFVDLENLRRAVPERAAKFARATLAPGDVLISKDGTIGRVAVVPPQLAGGNITQHVMRAPIHELMCRDYVVSAIRSDVCQKWLTGETKGVALRGVNVEDFRRLPIPVPPYIEQERVLAEVDRRLSLLSETEAQVDANLQRADRLREAILQRAFSSSSSHRTSIHTKLMGDDERLGT